MRRSASKLLRRKGFTMLELLVAVSLSVVVVAGLYGVFQIQSRQLMYQDTQMYMHQNLRFAADILSRSTRMAGYGTGGATRGPMGYDYSADSSDDDYSLPALVAYDGGTSGTDAITVVYADPSLEMTSAVATIEACSATSITFDMSMRNYSSLIENYSSGELLMCWDYDSVGRVRSYVWEITADGDSATGAIDITSNSGTYSDFDSSCGTTENLPPIMNCSRGVVVSFYIDNDESDNVGPGSDEHPVLMMDLNFTYPSQGAVDDDVPLVDDIEDMQIEYCPADDDCSEESNWEDGLSLDGNGNYEGETAWMVRFSLVARTPREDVRTDHFSEKRPGVANHSASSTADGYHRQLLNTQVTIRNLRLL